MKVPRPQHYEVVLEAIAEAMGRISNSDSVVRAGKAIADATKEMPEDAVVVALWVYLDAFTNPEVKRDL
jgi:hypothetical protein